MSIVGCAYHHALDVLGATGSEFSNWADADAWLTAAQDDKGAAQLGIQCMKALSTGRGLFKPVCQGTLSSLKPVKLENGVIITRSAALRRRTPWRQHKARRRSGEGEPGEKAQDGQRRCQGCRP